MTTFCDDKQALIQHFSVCYYNYQSTAKVEVFVFTAHAQ